MVARIRTHVNERKANGNPFFPRDCPEYEVKLPTGQSLWVLPNHFTSKFGGGSGTDAARREQSTRVKDILGRFDLRTELVVVLGDFNDTPDLQSPLRPLLDLADLRDVLNQLPAGEPRWTYRTPKNQIDYLLVSKPLWDARAGAGIYRRGMFLPNVNRFQSIDSVATAGSDHAAPWADFNL
jgi:endonuclease/exonuclease/phosphatase family metal-dependent hydrolase